MKTTHEKLEAVYRSGLHHISAAFLANPVRLRELAVETIEKADRLKTRARSSPNCSPFWPAVSLPSAHRKTSRKAKKGKS